MYCIQAETHFDAAHFLTAYHGKCENLHGHRWRVVVTLEIAELQDGEGTGGETERDMVMDFTAFKRTINELADSLDHTFLVEEGSLKPATVAALEDEGFVLTMLPFRTTSENLARWFYDRLVELGLPVAEVECDETPNNRAFYRK